MSTQSQTAATGTAADTSTLVRRALVALIASVVGNTVVVFVAGFAGVAPNFDPLSYGPVAVFTAVGVVGAAVVYAVLARFVADPNRTFTLVAAAVLLVSFVPDVLFAPQLPGATTAGVVALAVTHVVAAVACVAALTGRV